MFEVPIDAWYTWLGTAVAATSVLGVALALPTAPPPNAAAAADSVDAVAGAPHNATGSHPVDAASVKLSAHAIALRSPGGVTRAPLAFGPVTPVPDDGPLARVLAGAPPGTVFDGPAAIVRAARDARERQDGWERGDSIRVRTVVWGDRHVTLVGA